MNEILLSIITVVCVLVVALGVSAGLIWLERRLLGQWQDRYGPNRAGPFGLLQVVADGIKMVFKEDWIPPFADKPVFIFAPAVVVSTMMMTFAVIPYTPVIQVVNLNIGLLFFSDVVAERLQCRIGRMGITEQVPVTGRRPGRSTAVEL